MLAILQKGKLKLSYVRKCVQGQVASHSRAKIQTQPGSCCPQATGSWFPGLRISGKEEKNTKGPAHCTVSHTCQEQGGTKQIWIT